MTAFRKMVPADIPAGLSLCRSAGWNQLSRDWQVFLEFNSEGNRVYLDDNRKIIGTVATISYEQHVGWIGMVLVDPAHQRMGIGSQLIQQGVELLREVETVKLDATAAGREVYLKYGFVDEYVLARMQGRPELLVSSFCNSVRSLNSEDIDRIIDHDASIFGANRGALLQALFSGAPEFALICERDDEVKGYCFGRYGYYSTHIGPLVASSQNVAQDILQTVLSRCGSSDVTLDVPSRGNWIGWLLQMGFQERRRFMRMYRGPNRRPGAVEKHFAIVGPEFG